MLLATLIFGCGYLFGHLDRPVDPTTNAHAYQGPKIQAIACSVSVTNVSCVKEEYLERAFQSVLDAYGSFEDYIINGLDISKSDIDDFRSQVLISQ